MALAAAASALTVKSTGHQEHNDFEMKMVVVDPSVATNDLIAMCFVASGDADAAATNKECSLPFDWRITGYTVTMQNETKQFDRLDLRISIGGVFAQSEWITVIGSDLANANCTQVFSPAPDLFLNRVTESCKKVANKGPLLPIDVDAGETYMIDVRAIPSPSDILRIEIIIEGEPRNREDVR